MPVPMADEFRRHIKNHLRSLCSNAAESAAVEEFCQLPGGYGRIVGYLRESGVNAADVANLLDLSERTKSVFHRMKKLAVETYKSKPVRPRGREAFQSC